MRIVSSRAILMTTLLLAGALTGLFTPGVADVEPNDSFVLAEVLAPGTPINGKLNATDPSDYYQFTIVNGQMISANLQCTDGDQIWGYLYDPSQDQLLATDYINAMSNEIIEYTTDPAKTGTYYYLVETGGVANYTLSVTITDQNDANSGMDAANDINNAYPIAPGGSGSPNSYGGWVADGDYEDFYQFEVTTAQTLRVTLTVGTQGPDDLWFYVYNPQKDSFLSSDYLNPGVSETQEYTTSLATQGTYYIEVEGGKNSYDLSVQVIDQDDALQGIDAADDLVAPTMVGLLNIHDGWIGDDDEADCYGFNVVDGQKILFMLKTGTKGTDDLWAYIYGPDKEAVAETDYLNPGVSEEVEWTTSYATAGLYYVKVEGGKNNYSFSFQVEDQNDANAGIDANDDFTNALGILEGTDLPGWLADDDEVDYYKIDLVNGQTLNVTFTTGTKTTDTLWLEMFDPQKNSIDDTEYLNPDVSETLSYTSSHETPGIYYLKATGGDNNYKMTVEVMDQDDAGLGKDAPQDLTKAVHLLEGQHDGMIADADTADAYNFTVKAHTVFTVNLTTTSATGTVTVELFDTQKNSLGSITAAAGVTQSYELPLAKAPASDSLFFARATGDGGRYTYKLDVVLPTKPPDTTPPVVDILTPLALVFKAPGIVMTGTATDNGTVTQVQFSFNNATFVNCTGQGAWTCNLDLAAGSNKITVRARDVAGNWGHDEMVLTLDTTSPTMTIDATNGSKVKKSTLVLAGTAADNMGLAMVEVSLNGGSFVTANGTGTWAIELTLTKGDNDIRVRITDTAGNVKEETIHINYKKEKKESPGFEAVIFVAAMAIAVVVLLRRKR